MWQQRLDLASPLRRQSRQHVLDIGIWIVSIHACRLDHGNRLVSAPGRPLKKARNGAHLNVGGHHRFKRWHQEGVLPGRLHFGAL